MNMFFRLLPLLLVALLAGCADNETQPSKRKSKNMTGVADSQFATNAVATNSVMTDTNMVDTNSLLTNTTPGIPGAFTAPTPVPTATSGDLPYGTPVPGRPGFVTSPHSPTAGYVDVRGFPPGSEVKDPYSGKIFLVP